MKRLQLTHPIVVACSSAALALSLSCGGPAPGPFILDSRPTAPPLCSQTIRTIRVSLTPDPAVPSTHFNSITRIEWELFWKCAISIPVNPDEGIGGRNTRACFLTQYVDGSPLREGNCNPPVGSGDPPPDFRVVRTTNIHDSFNFELDTTQGNICIRGRVFFLDGTPTLALPFRMWSVPLEGGEPIPDIGFTLRNTPTDPFPYHRSPSAAGCPQN